MAYRRVFTAALLKGPINQVFDGGQQNWLPLDLPVPEQGADRLDGLLVGVLFVRGVEEEGEQQVHGLACINVAVLPLGERL